jgi:DNA modification methylase
MPHEEVTIGDARLILGDCREVLPGLPKVDACITDPPYSSRTHAGHDASANGHRGVGKDAATRSTLGYESLSETDVWTFAKAFARISDGWIVWMCDHALVPHIEAALGASGRYVFAPLPFYAPGSRVRLSGDGPSSWTVWIVVARTAAQKAWGTLPGGYVLPPGAKEHAHMGGKPTWLMQQLVSHYSRQGDTVLDPCAGSGTTGLACLSLGRRFIGIERNRRSFDLACERIACAQAQGSLLPPEAPTKPAQEALVLP